MAMRDATYLRARELLRSAVRNHGEGAETGGRRAYMQLARHLTTPYVELERPADATSDDVGALVIRWCNAAMARFAGVLAPEDLVGRPLGTVAPMLLADLRLGLHRDGSHAQVTGRPSAESSSACQGLVTFDLGPGRYGVLIENAAFHQQAVEALARRARELAALHETLLQLNAETDLHALLGTIVARASGLLDAPRGGLYLMREGDDRLELAVSYGAPGAYIETTLHLGEGVSGRAAAEGVAVLVGAERSWDARDRAYPDAPFGPAVAVPLRLEGQIIGALYVGDDDRQLDYDHADARLLSMFADQAALVIQRTRLLEQAQRDAEERAVLLREVNHRVKNNLTAIVGLLYAQERSVAPEHREAYQEILSTLAARVQALATAHELLSRAAWGSVSFYDLASQVIGSVLGSVETSAGVIWRVHPSDVLLVSEAAQHVAMVLNELATNVVRHACSGREEISCDVAGWVEQGSMIIVFRDNGAGYPPAVIAGRAGGVGIDLVRNLVQRSLGGTLTLYNDGGAVARMELPARTVTYEGEG